MSVQFQINTLLLFGKVFYFYPNPHLNCFLQHIQRNEQKRNLRDFLLEPKQNKFSVVCIDIHLHLQSSKNCLKYWKTDKHFHRTHASYSIDKQKTLQKRVGQTQLHQKCNRIKMKERKKKPKTSYLLPRKLIQRSGQKKEAILCNVQTRQWVSNVKRKYGQK